MAARESERSDSRPTLRGAPRNTTVIVGDQRDYLPDSLRTTHSQIGMDYRDNRSRVRTAERTRGHNTGPQGFHGGQHQLNHLQWLTVSIRVLNDSGLSRHELGCR